MCTTPLRQFLLMYMQLVKLFLDLTVYVVRRSRGGGLQGSVLPALTSAPRRGTMTPWRHHCSNSETSLKIGQYLTTIWRTKKVCQYFWPPGIGLVYFYMCDITGAGDHTDSNRIPSFDLFVWIPQLLLVTLLVIQHSFHLCLQNAATSPGSSPLFIVSRQVSN